METSATLWSAARANDVATLEKLGAAPGVDLNARDPRGFSALMLAAYAGSGEAVAFLLSKGVDPNSFDNAGNSVLMGAAYKGDASIVKQLIAAGADVKARNHAGLDARGFAEMGGHVALLALV